MKHYTRALQTDTLKTCESIKYAMMPACESGQMPLLTVHFNTVYLLLTINYLRICT